MYEEVYMSVAINKPNFGGSRWAGKKMIFFLASFGLPTVYFTESSCLPYGPSYTVSRLTLQSTVKAPVGI